MSRFTYIFCFGFKWIISHLLYFYMTFTEHFTCYAMFLVHYVMFFYTASFTWSKMSCYAVCLILISFSAIISHYIFFMSISIRSLMWHLPFAETENVAAAVPEIFSKDVPNQFGFSTKGLWVQLCLGGR